MKRNIVIGREHEMAELRRSLESDRSEFVIVYGRRRVDKRTLWTISSIMNMISHMLVDDGGPSQNKKGCLQMI